MRERCIATDDPNWPTFNTLHHWLERLDGKPMDGSVIVPTFIRRVDQAEHARLIKEIGKPVTVAIVVKQ